MNDRSWDTKKPAELRAAMEPGEERLRYWGQMWPSMRGCTPGLRGWAGMEQGGGPRGAPERVAAQAGTESKRPSHTLLGGFGLSKPHIAGGVWKLSSSFQPQ